MAKLTAKQLAVIVAAAEAAFNRDTIETTYTERAEALGKLDAVSTKPELAKQFAIKYGTTVVERVSDGRGAPKGTLTYSFGSGDYDTDLVAGRASKAFRRMVKAAWEPEIAKAADTDAAESLAKALKRVVDGRSKLSVADRRRFAKLAAGLGVSFV